MHELPTIDASRLSHAHARQLDFELDGHLPRHFCPSQPEFSHAANGFMVALPALEPYFIHNVREALLRVDDERLREEAQLFVAQEGRHAHQHRALNAALSSYYPELPKLVQEIRDRLERSRAEDSLEYRLAYTAGYEAITYHLTGFMMDKRHVWLADADPGVFSLLCWHGAEEMEHKNLAFDLFQAVSGDYRLRCRGLTDALVTTVKDLRRVMRYMLSVDGLWEQRACQFRVKKVRIAFLMGFAPRLLGYFRPDYHPSRYADPPTLRYWLERYAAGDDLRRITPATLDAASSQRVRAQKCSFWGAHGRHLEQSEARDPRKGGPGAASPRRGKGREPFPDEN